MKLAKVVRNGQCATACIVGDTAVILTHWQSGEPEYLPFNISGIERATLDRCLEDGDRISLADLRLAPPLSPTSKVLCLGLNYQDHVEETLNAPPPTPVLFTRFPDSLVGQNDELIRPQMSEQYDFEGELAVIIGAPGRHIREDQAWRHVFGYSILMDGSVRDYQRHSRTAGKNFWRSGSLGPWIVTADEIPDLTALKLETRLSGATVQSAQVSQMVFGIPRTLAYVSQFTPLRTGDVVAMGTPAGIGSRRKPPLWMRHGDQIEIEISAIGTLSNRIVDER